MRIPCPICGPRDQREFRIHGAAMGPRPAAPLDEDPAALRAVFNAWVYRRDNPAGVLHEEWYHAAGCRAWLVVTRNTLTHEVLGAQLAAEAH